MGLVRQFWEETYLLGPRFEPNRVYPIDDYTLPAELLAAASEYYVLRVPLLGQHFGHKGKSPRRVTSRSDWCGRTSAVMAYNFREAIKGGDPKERYISFWDGGKGWYLDLRFPNSDRAFHKYPKTRQRESLGGVRVSGNVKKLLGYEAFHLFPYGSGGQARIDEAKEIGKDPARTASMFEPMLRSLRANNPVVFFTGISRNPTNPIHIICVAGYALLKDTDGSGDDQLWLVIADPSSKRPVKGGAFNPCLLEDLSGLKSEHDLIVVRTGAWYEAKGALYLLRARKLLEENPRNKVRYDLFMDYWGGKGGLFLGSHTPTPVPRDAVWTDANQDAVSLPFQSPDEPVNPAEYFFRNELAGVGGYFPLGLSRNVHSGVHLPLDAQDVMRFLDENGDRAITWKEAAGSIYEKALGRLHSSDYNAFLAEQKQAKKKKQKQKQQRGEPAATREIPKDGLERLRGPVRCMAPGTIVAARLGGRPGDATQEDSCQLTWNYNCFVLVRHEIEGVDKGERYVVYSLYYHLVPPNWDDPEHDVDFYAKVPWLNRLVLQRNGSVIGIDPSQEGFRKRWWQRPEKGSAIYGDTFQEERDLPLQDRDDCLTRIERAPEAEVEEAFEGLREGKLITFSKPYLIVERGEILGFSSPSSSETAFLHWEILAPAAGDLRELLKKMDADLGLNGLFEVVEERRDDNTLQPEEVEALLDLLPSVDRPAASTGKGPLLTGSYQPHHLHALYGQAYPRSPSGAPGNPQDPGELAFYLPAAQDPVEGGSGYPLRVELTNHQHDGKPTYPEGTFSFEVSFDPPSPAYDGQRVSVEISAQGGQVSIMVPADARRAIFTPGEGHLLADAPRPAAGALLKEDVAQLIRLVSARWRRVVMVHLNEWSEAGLDKALRKRARRLPRSDRKALIASTAWWGVEETPVLGGKLAEPLFAGSPSATQLPKQAKLLDNVNPIAFAWALNLLCRAGKARLRTEWELFEDRAADDVTHLGWIPALTNGDSEPHHVGDTVYALAITRGEPRQASVSFTASGARTVELGDAQVASGSAALALDFPLWGKWTLAAKGASDAEVLGSAELEVLTPLLAQSPPSARRAFPQLTHGLPLPVESKKQEGVFRWHIEFSEHRPSELAAYVLLKTQVHRSDTSADVGNDAPVSAYGIPVVFKLTPRSDGMKVEDGYYLSGPLRAPLGPNFRYRDYCRARHGGGTGSGETPPCKVAVDLAEAVQKVRWRYKKSVYLKSLSEDGLTATIFGWKTKAFEAAIQHCQGKGWFESVDPVDVEVSYKGRTLTRKGFQVSVAAPPDRARSGTLVAEFDARTAYVKLLERLQPSPGESLRIRFGLLIPNATPRLQSPDSSFDWDRVKQDCAQEYIEGWAYTSSASISQPAFGPTRCEITTKGNLRLRAALLGGDGAFWKRAAPAFTITYAEPGKGRKQHRVGSVDRGRTAVTAVLKLSAARYRGLKLSAQPSCKGGAVFQGRTDPVDPGQKVERDTTPSLGPVTLDFYAFPGRLWIQVQTANWPASKSLRVRLLEGDRPLELAEEALHYPLASGKKRDMGTVDPKGVLHAFVPLLPLYDELQPVDGPREFSVRVERPAELKGRVARVHHATIAPLTVHTQLEPAEAIQ